MLRATSLLVSLFALVIFALPSGPAQAGVREEAERQLRFARQELGDERFDRALASAESALRLEASLYEAMVVKALAYEGLGNLRMAEVMLLAYGEVATGLGPNPEVEAALARVQAAMASPDVGPRGRRRPARLTSSEPAAAVDEVTPTTGGASELDPEAFRERVHAGLKQGKCGYARAAALELTAAAPDLADGYRLLGDAARCDGSTREAVLAYRSYKSLGGTDPAVDLMLRGLTDDLALLVVTVEAPLDPGTAIPEVTLDFAGETLAEAVRSDGTVSFPDLPVGVELRAAVLGMGLNPTDQTIEALQPGERRQVTLSPEWIGLGTVQLGAFDDSLCDVRFFTPDGELVLQPGRSRDVTVGPVTAVVSGEHGTIEVPLESRRGVTIGFDPLPWLPAELTLVNLPTGSTVRVFIEGIDGATGESEFQVPIGTGSIDPATGVRVAPPYKTDSLPGGTAGIFVSHPLLGSSSLSTVLASGEANATTFGWRSMEGVSAVTSAYGAWQVRTLEVRRQAAGGTVAPAALAIGAGIASGILWGAAISTGERVTTLADEARSAEGLDEVATLARQHEEAAELERGLIVAGSVTAGTAVVGAVLTGVFGRSGHKRVLQLGEWDPVLAASD